MSKNFSGLNLQGRSFKRQDLTGANFSNADIRGVDFTRANLSGANFTGARGGLRSPWVIPLLSLCFLIAAAYVVHNANFILATRVVPFNQYNQTAEHLAIAAGTIGTIAGATGGRCLSFFWSFIAISATKVIPQPNYLRITLTLFWMVLGIVITDLTILLLLSSLKTFNHLLFQKVDSTGPFFNLPSDYSPSADYSLGFAASVVGILAGTGLYALIKVPTEAKQARLNAIYIAALVGLGCGLLTNVLVYIYVVGYFLINLWRFTPILLGILTRLLEKTSACLIIVSFFLALIVGSAISKLTANHLTNSHIYLFAVPIISICSFLIVRATSNTCFHQANLTSANFTEANLGYTDFRKAKLQGTNFSRAKG